MSRIISPGMMQDFKKELRLAKSTGRFEKGSAEARQQVYLRISAAHDLKWMLVNKKSLLAELEGAIEEVRNG